MDGAVGNFSARHDDIAWVTCTAWREALSARLDGEDLGDAWLASDPDRWPGRAAREASGRIDAAAVDAHLATCAECRQWYADAVTVTRLARLDSTVTSSQGVSDSVLDATPRPTRARIARALRLVLALLGAGQVLLAAGQLAGPMGGTDETVMHMTHEFAAWNAAVGASFLFIAWRRTRPSALLPLLTAFVGVLTVLSIDDLVHGTVTAARLGSHLLILAGYAVIVAMSRPSLTFDAPPGARRRSEPSAWRLDAHDDSEREAPAWPDAPDIPAASMGEHPTRTQRHAA